MNLGEYFKQVEARTLELDRLLEKAIQKRREGKMLSLREHILGPSCTEVLGTRNQLSPESMVYDPKTGATYVNPLYEILHWKSPRRDN